MQCERIRLTVSLVSFVVRCCCTGGSLQENYRQFRQWVFEHIRNADTSFPLPPEVEPWFSRLIKHCMMPFPEEAVFLMAWMGYLCRAEVHQGRLPAHVTVKVLFLFIRPVLFIASYLRLHERWYTEELQFEMMTESDQMLNNSTAILAAFDRASDNVKPKHPDQRLCTLLQMWDETQTHARSLLLGGLPAAYAFFKFDVWRTKAHEDTMVAVCGILAKRQLHDMLLTSQQALWTCRLITPATDEMRTMEASIKHTRKELVVQTQRIIFNDLDASFQQLLQYIRTHVPRKKQLVHSTDVLYDYSSSADEN